MRWDEVREIAPEFTRVVGRGTLAGGIEWRVRPSHYKKLLPYVGAPNSLELELWDEGYAVLETVRIRYPSVAAATAALTAAWGPEPADGWHNREQLTRVYVDQNGDVFLEPYQPREELLADGLELSWRGRHLLDADPEELAQHVHFSPGSIALAAKAAGVSLSTAYQWKPEFDAEPRE